MLNSFQRFNADQNLIHPGDRILCAVSGGADSMALLWCLYRLQDRLEISLSALHCNHHLRGGDSDADAAFVADFCAAHGIACQVVDLDVSALQAATGQSLEAAARTLRYQALNRAAGPDGRIATAHTAQDNLETSLIHLVRGTSPRGLGGIPVQRGNIIRPLLFAGRDQILAFLQAEGIPHRQDTTNDTDFCLRNRLRRHVLPLLGAENPNLAAAWLDTSQQLRREDAYLSGLALDAAEQIAVAAGDGFSIAALNQLHPVLRRRALFHWLERFGVPQPQLCHLEALEGLIASPCPSGQIMLPGCRLQRSYDTITRGAAAAASFAPVTLAVPGTVRIPELGLRITCKPLKKAEKITNSPTTFTIKYDMIINGSLLVRPRSAGDSLRLPGGTRSVKRLLIDRKIPASQRERIPVIATATDVIAVGFIGVNDDYRPTPPCSCLQIRIEKEDSPPCCTTFNRS